MNPRHRQPASQLPRQYVTSITSNPRKRNTSRHRGVEHRPGTPPRRIATPTSLNTATAGTSHSFVTTMLDAGVSLRDVQIAARHADPRTTMRYDRARKNLDRHPNYILAAYMASGT